MACRADGLAKAPQLVPPPSGQPLWALGLALVVAVPSLWVTWGHSARWLQGAVSSCLLPLQGHLPGVIWVQHKDSGSSQGTVPSLGVQALCGLCVPLQWDSDSGQGPAASQGSHGPSLSPLCCSSRASCRCWGSCSILALARCTRGWGTTAGTPVVSPSPWQCPWHGAVLPVPSLAPQTLGTMQGALQRMVELPPHRQPVGEKSASNKHRQTPPPEISQEIGIWGFGKGCV